MNHKTPTIAATATRTAAPRRKPNPTTQKLPAIPKKREHSMTESHPFLYKDGMRNATGLATLLINIFIYNYYNNLITISIHDLLFPD
jgi:hypothetical protein